MLEDPLILTEIFIGLAFILGTWTVILEWFINTKKMLRWKGPGAAIVLGFFFSLLVNSLGIILVYYELTEIGMILGAVVSLAILIAVLIYSTAVSWQIIKLESFAVLPGRASEKPVKRPEYEKMKSIGIPAIDSLMQGPIARAPFMIFGKQGTHPWSLAHDFAADGMNKDEACIYIMTSRPPEFVLEQLEVLMKKRYGKSLAHFKDRFGIVDCFTPFAGFGERAAFPFPEDYRKEGWNYIEADPRDLNDIHMAAAKIRKNLKGKHVRIIYDTFSTIAELTDPEALYQYLMHQIAYEEKFGYISCYIVRKEEHIGWLDLLVAGSIKMGLEEGERTIEIEKMPGKYRSGAFKIDEEDKIVRRAGKPKFGKDMGGAPPEPETDDY